MKIIAYYLPQFHLTEDNNNFWGNGFTEWEVLHKAKPLFKGHQQPRIPIKEYDLLDPSTLRWQAEIAKQHGIYGFCLYHYWFSGKKMLYQPLEILLQHPEIDIPFCLCWANQSWTDAWRSPTPKLLIEQKYDAVNDWENHFDYLLPFLKDPRYIRIDGKPLFVIYRPQDIPDLQSRLQSWRQTATKHGVGPILFASQHPDFFHSGVPPEWMDYTIEYHPCDVNQAFDSHLLKMHTRIMKALDKRNFFERTGLPRPVRRRSYDKVWGNILRLEPQGPHSLPGAFVGWDNTPRYGRRGSCICGQSPEKFCRYLSAQIRRAKEIYHTDLLFLFAWNEWSEGGYLEPDVQNGMAYLQALQKALQTAEVIEKRRGSHECDPCFGASQ